MIATRYACLLDFDWNLRDENSSRRQQQLTAVQVAAESDSASGFGRHVRSQLLGNFDSLALGVHV